MDGRPRRGADSSPMEAHLESVQPVLMVRDVPAAIRFYVRLGFELVSQNDPDRPRFAGLRRDGVSLYLQWHHPREWKPERHRPAYRFAVDDVDALHAQFAATGGLADATSVLATAWDTREFHLHDPDGNELQFYRAADSPATIEG